MSTHAITLTEVCDIWNEAARVAMDEAGLFEADGDDLGVLGPYEPENDVFAMRREEDIENHARETVYAYISTKRQCAELRETLGVDQAASLVNEWQNCSKGKIADDGRIYIADHQTGHWLPGDKLSVFVKWTSFRGQDTQRSVTG